MRYISPRSIQPVISSLKLKPTTSHLLPPPAALRGAPTKYFHTSVPQVNSRSRAKNIYRSNLQRQPVRHCSYQRRMCYQHADVVSGSMDMTNSREILPTNVKPIHYDLTLEPNLEKFTFEGTVIIEYVTSCGVLHVCRDIMTAPLPQRCPPLKANTLLSIVLKSRRIQIRYL